MTKPGKSLAEIMVDGVKAVTKDWAKQRRAEERHKSARAYRVDRMTRRRAISIRDASFDVMERAYMAASANGTLPAHARQVMYQARPLIQATTDRQLNDQYFCQQLLPDYMEETGVAWDVVFDDRGHFTEPHTGHEIGLGTISVRNYLRGIGAPMLLEPKLRPAMVATHGPQGRFGAVLFIEKEGFMPLLKATQLAERHDIAVMSTKGISNTSARMLIDEMCGEANIPLLVLHDFDKSGFSILGTLKRDTRRYAFGNSIKVVDLGLRLADVRSLGLEAERAYDRGKRNQRTINLRLNGATEEEIKFLLERRVELNALPSDQLAAFIERKLQHHGVKKIVPGKKDLAVAYKLFVRGKRIEEIVKKEIAKKDGADVTVPADLERRVRAMLKSNRAVRWNAVVAHIAKAAPAKKTTRA